MSLDPERNDQARLPGTSLDRELAALRNQVARLGSENARLLRLLELSPAQARPPGPAQTGIFDGLPGLVDATSSPEMKIAFFASMFAARTDVHAVRWENVRTGRSGWMPAVRGGWRKGMAASSREYLPLTSDIVASHLTGDIDLGLYPLLDGDRCWWLAADFDGSAAMLDALSYLKAARAVGAPGSAGGVTLGAGCARLVVLYLSGAGGNGQTSRHRIAPRSHRTARSDGPIQLRPALSLPGRSPDRRGWQPDRGPIAGTMPAARRHGVPGHEHPGTPR